MLNSLPTDRVIPEHGETTEELLAEAELKVFSYRQDLMLKKMGDIMKKHFPSEPEPFVNFTCPGKLRGVYIIGHKNGRIADIGQGIIMSRVALKRQFLMKKQRKLDKTKDYRVAERIAEYDSDPTQWWVQYIPFHGITAKDQARRFEQVIHQRYIMEDNAPMFASLHMAGVG
jgi:hypothetical protein